MGVNYYCDTTVTCFNLSIHLSNLIFSKVLRVENKIFISFWITLLICPFDIHPKHIYWEAKLCEISISLDYHLSTDVGPLTKMESKHVNGCHWDKTRNNSKIFLDFFESICSLWSKDYELESTRFWNKIDVFSIIKIWNTNPGVSWVNPSYCSTMSVINWSYIGYTTIERLLIIWYMSELICCKKLIRVFTSIF